MSGPSVPLTARQSAKRIAPSSGAASDVNMAIPSAPGAHAPDTTRDTVQRVAARVGVDAGLLHNLFKLCVQELLEATEKHGVCQMRGVGKFRHVSAASLHKKYPPGEASAMLTVFEPTNYVVRTQPFRQLQLASRLKSAARAGQNSNQDPL